MDEHIDRANRIALVEVRHLLAHCHSNARVRAAGSAIMVVVIWDAGAPVFRGLRLR
jgi:hypothetical protein